jgi:hypothetical protein
VTGPEHERVTVSDRNLFERILRGVREVLTIVALALLVFYMVATLAAVRAIGDRLSDGGTPDPGVTVTVPPDPDDTGCPSGPGQCGG